MVRNMTLIWFGSRNPVMGWLCGGALCHKQEEMVFGENISVPILNSFRWRRWLPLDVSFLRPFNEGSFTVSISTLPGISLEAFDKSRPDGREIDLSVPEVQTVGRIHDRTW